MTWVYALNDQRDRWFGEDKWGHFFGAAFVTCAVGWPWAIVASLAVEGLELWRWQRLGVLRQAMVQEGRMPWPWMTDRVSLKDLVADAAGIVLGILVC